MCVGGGGGQQRPEGKQIEVTRSASSLGLGDGNIVGAFDLGNGTQRIYYQKTGGNGTGGGYQSVIRPYTAPKTTTPTPPKPPVKPVVKKKAVTNTGGLPSNQPGYGTPGSGAPGSVEPGRLFPSRGRNATGSTATFGERYYASKNLGALDDTIARFGTDNQYVGANKLLGAA